MDGELRGSLMKLIRYKFAKYPNVVLLAEDIVHDAYLDLRTGRHYAPDKENYGYLSVVCVRMAYRRFMEQSANFNQAFLDAEGTSLIDETDIVDEILQAEDTYAVLESLKVLRDIERIVITQRYYGSILAILASGPLSVPMRYGILRMKLFAYSTRKQRTK